MFAPEAGTQRRPDRSRGSRGFHPGRTRWLAGATLFLAAIGAPRSAHAGDWYVDARSGSNSNDGSSPATAWRTITHALGSIAAQPPGADKLFVAPGVYDPVLGEVFPLHPRPRLRIVGTQGSAQTILEGSPSHVLSFDAIGVDVFDAESGVEGLTLRGSSSGIEVKASAGSSSPAIRDLVVQDMTGAGVVVNAATGRLTSASTYPSFERVVVERCHAGFLVTTASTGWLTSSAGLTLTDCVVRASTTDGIRLSTASHTGGIGLSMQRCRIVENGGNGLTSDNRGDLTGIGVTATACLFARNLGSGAHGYNGSVIYASGLFRFRDCTFGGNALAGIRAVSRQHTQLNNTILAGNGDDLDLDSAPDAFWSNSADGDLLAFATCMAADPLFVAPSSGDFRLRFGSPCIDAGEPARDGVLDLLLHVRPIDGDLDTQAAGDMGAFEFEPLHLDGTGRLGQPLRFEFWGAPGAHARLLFSRQPLAEGRSTPFGQLSLRRDALLVLGELVIGPLPPAVRVRNVPDDPALIGRTFSMQTLTDSGAAPRGLALSNPVSYVLAP
jgi:hypothetical protein